MDKEPETLGDLIKEISKGLRITPTLYICKACGTCNSHIEYNFNNGKCCNCNSEL